MVPSRNNRTKKRKLTHLPNFWHHAIFIEYILYFKQNSAILSYKLIENVLRILSTRRLGQRSVCVGGGDQCLGCDSLERCGVYLDQSSKAVCVQRFNGASRRSGSILRSLRASVMMMVSRADFTFQASLEFPPLSPAWRQG